MVSCRSSTPRCDGFGGGRAVREDGHGPSYRRTRGGNHLGSAVGRRRRRPRRRPDAAPDGPRGRGRDGPDRRGRGAVHAPAGRGLEDPARRGRRADRLVHRVLAAPDRCRGRRTRHHDGGRRVAADAALPQVPLGSRLAGRLPPRRWDVLVQHRHPRPDLQALRRRLGRSAAVRGLPVRARAPVPDVGRGRSRGAALGRAQRAGTRRRPEPHRDHGGQRWRRHGGGRRADGPRPRPVPPRPARSWSTRCSTTARPCRTR